MHFMQGAFAQEGRAPFQASATPQMAGQRLARREPPESTMTALQRLTREQPLPAHCALSWRFRGGLWKYLQEWSSTLATYRGSSRTHGGSLRAAFLDAQKLRICQNMPIGTRRTHAAERAEFLVYTW